MNPIGNSFSIKLNAVQMTCVCILAFTLLNGFYDSLRFEFKDLPTVADTTFLFLPQDRFADLVKPTFAVPPFGNPDTDDWDIRYKEFYQENEYLSPDLTKGDLNTLIGESIDENEAPRVDGYSDTTNIHVICLHVTPTTLLGHIFLKKLILASSPQLVVYLFCITAVLVLGFLCWLTWNGSLYEYVFVSLVLVLSYPFLMIVSRGNFGSLIVGCFLTLFVYEACRGRRFVWAALCLVIACNFRPNALILAPLLICLNPKWLLFGCAAVVVALAGCMALSFQIDGVLYPGYSFRTFLDALNIYNINYVLGPLGDGYNNSAYGGFKAVLYFFEREHLSWYVDFLAFASTAFMVLFSTVAAWAFYLFYKGRITKIQCAFVAIACYALFTPVFGTYHTFVFASILFVLGREVMERGFGRADYVMLAVTAFILIPKNYIFIDDISWETVLNPLALISSILYILIKVGHVAAIPRNNRLGTLLPPSPVLSANLP